MKKHKLTNAVPCGTEFRFPSKRSTLSTFLPACVVAILMFALSLSAQIPSGPELDTPPSDLSPVTPISTTLTPNLAVPAVTDNYLIGPGDLLSVFVYQMPQFTSQIRVTTHGMIRIPYVTVPIRAEGATAPELAHSIAQKLTELQLARDPQVQVTIRQVQSKPIIVTGAVRYPTTLEAGHPMSLLEVLARAGGVLDQAASGDVKITGMQRSNPRTQRIHLAQLYQGPNSGAGPILDGNEIVQVLPAPLIYLIGNFRKPGAFPLRIGQPITVIRALALGDGIADHADKKHIQIIRTNQQTGTRIIIPVNLQKILKHQLPDIALHNDDVLYIPENERGAATGRALDTTLSTLTLAFGYGLSSAF